jgi:hypothetical protein
MGAGIVASDVLQILVKKNGLDGATMIGTTIIAV